MSNKKAAAPGGRYVDRTRKPTKVKRRHESALVTRVAEEEKSGGEG